MPEASIVPPGAHRVPPGARRVPSRRPGWYPAGPGGRLGTIGFLAGWLGWLLGFEIQKKLWGLLKGCSGKPTGP